MLSESQRSSVLGQSSKELQPVGERGRPGRETKGQPEKQKIGRGEGRVLVGEAGLFRAISTSCRVYRPVLRSCLQSWRLYNL